MAHDHELVLTSALAVQRSYVDALRDCDAMRRLRDQGFFRIALWGRHGGQPMASPSGSSYPRK